MSSLEVPQRRDPFEMRIDHTPNRHLAFRVGEDVCLGAHLARIEIELVFQHLVGRVVEMESARSAVRLRVLAITERRG
jgi:cytochrome P450